MNNIEIFINFKEMMLFVDGFVFLSILTALHIARVYYPNLLFFSKGAIVFLPPELQPANKAKKPEVQILQLTYPQVKQLEMSSQYERILFIIVTMLLYLPLKLLLVACCGEWLLSHASMFCTLVGCILLIYVVKIGLQILWISPYSLKNCIEASLGFNGAFLGFYYLMRQMGMIDNTFLHTIIDYEQHLSIILSDDMSNTVNQYVLMGIVIVINVMLNLVTIPAVVKFGSWYTKTLKEVYYDENEYQPGMGAEERAEKQAREKRLKETSKITVRYLNIYLFSFLIYLFLCHPFLEAYLPYSLILTLQTLFFFLPVLIIIYTLKDAIQFHCSFAYRYVMQFFQAQTQEEKIQIRKRIVPYISQLWYSKIQLMMRVFIMLILFVMLMEWKGIVAGSQVHAVVGDTVCGVEGNKMAVLEGLYQCRYAQEVAPHINGGLLNTPELSAPQLEKYSLLTPPLMTAFISQILWYYCLGLYVQTVIYILFLRKAVYDM